MQMRVVLAWHAMSCTWVSRSLAVIALWHISLCLSHACLMLFMCVRACEPRLPQTDQQRTSALHRQVNARERQHREEVQTTDEHFSCRAIRSPRYTFTLRVACVCWSLALLNCKVEPIHPLLFVELESRRIHKAKSYLEQNPDQGGAVQCAKCKCCV